MTSLSRPTRPRVERRTDTRYPPRSRTGTASATHTRPFTVIKFTFTVVIAPPPPNPDYSPRMGGPDCVYKNIDLREDQNFSPLARFLAALSISTSPKSRKVNAAPKTPNRRSERAPSISSAPPRRATLEAAARSSNQHDQSRHRRMRARRGDLSFAQPASCRRRRRKDVGALSAASKLKQHAQ